MGASDTTELQHLETAARIARRGWGQVHPNPMVGCVLVRDGEAVGQGWHDRFGGRHAEIRALRTAGARANGATAFVSLEPCNHHGKTPPCSVALAQAGVRRVVYGAKDPGGESGGGAAALEAAGVEVEGPRFDMDRARLENPSFFHWAERRSSWVAVKLAMSLDGRIAAGRGKRTRVTGPEAERWVHGLRAGFDAILVGGDTARTDDPLLTIRHGPTPPVPPARLVVSARCNLPGTSRLLESLDRAPVHIFVGPEAPTGRIHDLEARGAGVTAVPAAGGGLDLRTVIDRCSQMGFRAILCEGGGRLASALLEARLAERLYVLFAPRVFGPDGVPGLSGPVGVEPWSDWRLAGIAEGLGDDVALTYRRRY